MSRICVDCDSARFGAISKSNIPSSNDSRRRCRRKGQVACRWASYAFCKTATVRASSYFSSGWFWEGVICVPFVDSTIAVFQRLERWALVRRSERSSGEAQFYGLAMRIIPADPDPREFNDMKINIFLPTACSLCDKFESCTSLLISRALWKYDNWI